MHFLLSGDLICIPIDGIYDDCRNFVVVVILTAQLCGYLDDFISMKHIHLTEANGSRKYKKCIYEVAQAMHKEK